MNCKVKNVIKLLHRSCNVLGKLFKREVLIESPNNISI